MRLVYGTKNMGAHTMIWMKMVLFSHVDNPLVYDVKRIIYCMLYEMRNDIYFYEYDNTRGDIFRGMPVFEIGDVEQIQSYTYARLFEKRNAPAQIVENYESRIYKPRMYLVSKYRAYSVYYGVHIDSDFTPENSHGFHFIKSSYKFPNSECEDTTFCGIMLDTVEIDSAYLSQFNVKYTTNRAYLLNNLVSTKYNKNAELCSLAHLVEKLYPNIRIYSYEMYLIHFHD